MPLPGILFHAQGDKAADRGEYRQAADNGQSMRKVQTPIWPTFKTSANAV
jgi:hypothetical protein